MGKQEKRNENLNRGQPFSSCVCTCVWLLLPLCTGTDALFKLVGALIEFALLMLFVSVS